MSVSRQFSSGVAWMALGNWAEQAINFAVFVILARLLGAETFGLLAMASAFVILSEFLVRESLSEYLIATPTPTPGHFNAAFWSLLVLGAVLSGILALAAAPIAVFFGQPPVRGLILALSPTILMIAATAVPVAWLRRELQFRTLSLRAIAGVFAGGVVGITMAATGFGVWSLAGQRLAQVGVNVAMAWYAVGWRPGLATSRAETAQVLSFGTTVLGLRAAELAATQTPSVIIGATLGPTALGLYSIAWRLIEIASFLIVTPLRMASQPAFASMTRSGARAADLLSDIGRMSGPIAFPIFAGLAVLAQPLLHLMFGTKWLDAAPVLSILAIIGAYLCIERVHVSFCLAAGRAGPITLIAWAEVGLSAALIWLAAPFGLPAIAAAFTATFLILWPLRLNTVARLAAISLPTLIRPHAAPIAATLLMAAATWGVAQSLAGQSPLLVILAGTLTGVVTFTTLTLLFMRDRIALLRSYITPRNRA